eukprot:CAMPEP_0119015010 /NCGR_PEP_ID=MMETSP1176-20130426/10510_1 /TAXON_ID=265551 /ORGANISM="Synedropsis recta cf, Strain CCMP1620" /LENGTH=146 /DNA_ID=CAMNT_0006968269 /DNA_START=20 /DNA_END=460 /DNA_ORIENTATION=+
MDFINNGAELVKDAATYLQDNAWYIIILMVSGYYLKTNYVDPYLQDRQYRPETQRKSDYGADMKRVRLEQQELASERAIVAAKERKIKEEADKARRNKAALKPSQITEDGDRLGKASNNSFNPLQPGSGNSGAGGYKPAKRSVGRS